MEYNKKQQTDSVLKRLPSPLLVTVQPTLLLLISVLLYWLSKHPYAGKTKAIEWLLMLTVLACFCRWWMSILSLLKMRQLLNKAVQSREKLLENFFQWQSDTKVLAAIDTLATALSLTLPLVAGVILAFNLLDIVQGVRRETLIFIILCGLPMAIVALSRFSFFRFKHVIPLFRSEDEDSELGAISGILIRRKKHPLLWKWVETQAYRLNAPIPDNIICSLQTSFFVTETPINLNHQMILRGKTLHLSLPFLMYLDKEEATCILGHELSHFAAGDGQFSILMRPIYRKAFHVVDTIFSATHTWHHPFLRCFLNPFSFLAHYYFLSFYAIQQFWSRKREFEADQNGVAVSSPNALATSLLRTMILQEPIQSLLGTIWQQGGELEGDFLSEIAQRIEQTEFWQATDCLTLQPHHPFDTHPTIAQRLEAQNIALTPSLIERANEKKRSDLLIDLELMAQPAVAEEQPVSADPGAEVLAVKNNDIITKLSQDFQKQAYYNKRYEQQALQSMVDKACNHYKFLTRSFRHVWLVCCVVGTLMLLLAAFVAWISPPFPPSDVSIRITFPSFFIGGLLLYAGVYTKKHHPDGAVFAELDAHGIRLGGLQTFIAWKELHAYEVTVRINEAGAMVIRLDLVPDYILSPEQKRQLGKTYQADKHQIRVTTKQFFEGYTDSDIADIMETYWQAAIARAILAEHFATPVAEEF